MALNNALADEILDAVEAAYEGEGTIDVEIYDSGFTTLLVAFEITSFASASDGGSSYRQIVGAGTPDAATAVGTGTAAVARVESGSNTYRFEGLVSLTGGGGDIELSPSLAITTGDLVTLESFRIKILALLGP